MDATHGQARTILTSQRRSPAFQLVSYVDQSWGIPSNWLVFFSSGTFRNGRRLCLLTSLRAPMGAGRDYRISRHEEVLGSIVYGGILMPEAAHAAFGRIFIASQEASAASGTSRRRLTTSAISWIPPQNIR